MTYLSKRETGIELRKINQSKLKKRKENKLVFNLAEYKHIRFREEEK